MSSRSLLLALTAMLLVGAVPDLSAAPDPEVSALLSVTHTPVPAVATCQTDPASGLAIYTWTYRTDVHNGFTFPVRVIEFGALNEWNGEWRKPAQAPFTAAQFGEWYIAADPAPEGWIQPGQTAADANNWNRSSFAVSARSRWYYLAEDAQGNRYLGRQEVELAPYVPPTEPWSDALPGTLVPLTVHWQQPGAELPTGAQARFNRLASFPYAPQAVLAAGGEQATPLQVRVPGLYRLQVYVPGYQLATATLVLEADDSGLEVTMQGVELNAATGPNALLFTFDDRHAGLGDVWQLQRDLEHESRAYVEAYQAHVKEHGAEIEFPDIRAPFAARLGQQLLPGPALPVRRFAAYQLPFVLPKFSADQARLITELLPADSPLLAADPGAAARAAARIDEMLGSRRVADLSGHHPDRLVRGHATAALAHLAEREGDAAILDAACAALATEFADLRELDFDRKVLDPARKVQVGRPLPAFAAPRLVGEGQLTEATAAGKYRLLHFWATWCGFCKAEMDDVHEVYEKYHAAGLEILSFSLDKTIEDAIAYQAGKWPMPWYNAFLAEGTKAPAAVALEVAGIPRLVLVDPQGMILAVDGELRGETMEQTVAHHLRP